MPPYPSTNNLNMKVGIISVVSGYSWAGSEEMWRVFAEEALKNGHSVAVCAQKGITESAEIDEFKKLGGIIFPYQQLNWLKRRFAGSGIYSRFDKIKNWNADILCVSGGAPDMFRNADLMSFLEGSSSRKVYIIQGNEEGYISGSIMRARVKNLYTNALRMICVSQSNATLLERQLAAALPNKVIIPNPIRKRLDNPLDWPESVDGKIFFATVGRYEINSKCQDRTLEAMSTTEWKKRNWQLNLFGSGPDVSYLQDLIRYYGLQKHVYLAGFERDFTKIWTNHHIHILNSRQEGLALALIESMFCGRPGIITRTGGNHELLRDGLDGYVSLGESPEIIHETIERAWNSRDKWENMGKSAYVRAAGWVPSNLGEIILQTITSS